MKVSEEKLRNKSYFMALHRQIGEGGAEAMFYDLQVMDLGDWHPREIPDVLLKGEALQEQQMQSLPLLEQWWLGLLHAGVLPSAEPKHPNWARAKNLRADAAEKFPRLRMDLSDKGMTDFLKDKKRTGILCELKQLTAYNVWTFPPLVEARTAWEGLYGPTKWDRVAEEWGASAVVVAAPAPKSPPAALLTVVSAPAEAAKSPVVVPAPWRRRF
jgi:hypothetical protein